MGLRITRAVNTVVFGGYDLDEKNTNASFDHRIWIRGVRRHKDRQEGIINIKTNKGVEEHVIQVGDPLLELAPDVAIEMVGVRDRIGQAEPYCEVCGRGHSCTDRHTPQAELALHAPRSYRLIRDNARRKTR